MKEEALVKLERIANNLPIKSPTLERIDGDFGEIYFAYGEDARGIPHGVWGYMEWGRPLEFKKGTPKKWVRQALVDDAAGFIALCHEKGLLDGKI
jgi:hypothetical protein